MSSDSAPTAAIHDGPSETASAPDAGGLVARWRVTIFRQCKAGTVEGSEGARHTVVGGDTAQGVDDARIIHTLRAADLEARRAVNASRTRREESSPEANRPLCVAY